MMIKPARVGEKIRDPISRAFIPAEGKEVPRSTFWIRRLACGDVVIVEPEAPPAEPVSLESVSVVSPKSEG